MITSEVLNNNSDPCEVYDALMAEVDPGMHHERELNEFYERLGR
jgi:hypothetical protein